MRAKIIALPFALVLLGTSAQVLAQDDTTTRAREAFNRGVELYEQGRYQDALEAFRTAFGLRPHPAVRVNLANCLARLGKAVEGTYHFRRYLREREGEVEPRQRAEIQREIDSMRLDIAEVNLRVEPASAEILVDGAPPETRIGMSLYLEPGRHVLEARKPGMATAREEIDVPGGSRREVVLTLREDATAPAPPPTPPSTGEPGEPPAEPETEPEIAAAAGGSAEVEAGSFRELMPWIGAGGAVLSLGVAVALGVSALSAEDEFDKEVAAYEADPANRDLHKDNASEWKDAADTRALLADVFFVVTLLLGAGTVYLFMQAGEDEEASGVAAAPWVAPGSAGLVLAGPLAP